LSLVIPVPEADRSMQEFAAQFGQFAEVVADALRYGPNPALAERFCRIRAWLLSHHPAVRACLRGYLPVEQPLGTSLTLPRDSDVFESLLSYPTLDSVVNTAERALLQKLVAASGAIESWRGAMPA